MWEKARGTNQQSWSFVLDFIATFPEPLWSEWKALMKSVLLACIDAGLDQYFRAGQSVSQIIISTAKEHGLEKYNPPPPFITLGWKLVGNEREYFIAYSRRNLFDGSAPESLTIVDSDNVFPVLRSYMAQLWNETKAPEPLPAALAEGI